MQMDVGIQRPPHSRNRPAIQLKMNTKAPLAGEASEVVKVSDKVSIRVFADATRHLTQSIGVSRTQKFSIWCSRRESNPEPWD